MTVLDFTTMQVLLFLRAEIVYFFKSVLNTEKDLSP